MMWWITPPANPPYNLRTSDVFTGREKLTSHPPSSATARRPSPQIKKRSIAQRQIYRFVGGIAVDALVFEFMGLAMLALCVVVLAVPASQRAPGKRVRDI
jgi:hypothetical protein